MTQYKLVPVEPTPEMIQAAFDALEAYPLEGNIRRHYRAMLAAAPEPDVEPVAWVECDGELVWNNREAAVGRNLYTAPPPAKTSEQEPFTVLVRKHSWLPGQWEAAPCGFPDYGKQWADERINVYTAPQPAKQPLTEEQINEFFQGMEPNNGFWLSFARAIEAAHGIGATGGQSLQLQNSTVVGMNLQLQDDTIAELEQEARLMRARMERLQAERDELLEAARQAVTALAHASEQNPIYQTNYKGLSAAIAKVEGGAS